MFCNRNDSEHCLFDRLHLSQRLQSEEREVERSKDYIDKWKKQLFFSGKTPTRGTRNIVVRVMRLFYFHCGRTWRIHFTNVFAIFSVYIVMYFHEQVRVRHVHFAVFSIWYRTAPNLGKFRSVRCCCCHIWFISTSLKIVLFTLTTWMKTNAIGLWVTSSEIGANVGMFQA